MKESLEHIESELIYLINLDKKNWTHFYLLLKKVEEEGLWQTQFKSFTQWVKEFSIKTKTHESIIWSRKKAGKVYESYQSKKKEQGIEVAPITETNISADSLVILDKINKYDENVAAKLVDKVINKEITKKDLREVYKSIRPENVSTIPKRKLSEEEIEISNKNSENNIKTNEKITANKIVSTLCGIEWLKLNKTIKRKAFRTAFEQNKYKAFTEFPVFIGTTKKSRRMDMLIAENITSENTWDLNLHCVEIKVSKSDLINDSKYTEYSDFVDFMWIAIPADLVEEAKNNKFKDCGIIVVDEAGARVEEQAKKLNSDRKIETLSNLALKIL